MSQLSSAVSPPTARPVSALLREALEVDPEPVTSTRSPRALGRLLAYGLAALVAVGILNLLDQASLGVRTDAQQAADHLPSAAGAVVDALALTIAAMVLLVGIVRAALDRSWRLLATLIVAPPLVGLGALAVAERLTGRWAPTGAGDATMEALLAAGTVGLVLLRIGSPSRWQVPATVAFVVAALVGGAWVDESVLGRLIALTASAAVGALVALVVGTPSRHASRSDLAASLARAGMPVRCLEPQGGDARGSVPWVAELVSGTEVFVKTYGDEERIADLLFRLWRGLRLRGSGDARPHSSLLHAVEHEAFAAGRASAAGARVPRVLALGALANGGVFAVHEAIAGRSLDAIVADDGSDALTDPVLREAWSMVRTLHRAGIAHRDLRSSNLVVDEQQRVWLVDFAFSDVLADREVQQRDLVELLASTADLVGPERAIDAALATLGHVEWEEALPMVQPLAVSAATRGALGRSGFSALRAELARRLGAPEPELPRLARVDGRTLLTLAALTVAVWALLPQIAQSGDLWELLPEANRTMLALAAVASLLTYVGASASLRGAVPEDLPPLRTLVVQVASSFTNRVTPGKVGGVALNVRWLIKEGVPSPVAAAAISVNAIGGLLVHISLTVFTIAWAGKVGLGDLSLPSARTVGAGLGLIAAVAAISYAIAPLRDLVSRRVVPRARQSGEAIAEVARRPRHLVLLFGGSAFVTACYVAALDFSLRAVGQSVPLSTVALVYLAGSALASAAPTPGGLGATEAVFAAALATAGVEREAALAAVLLYRFATFWLPIAPGYVAFGYLQRRGAV